MKPKEPFLRRVRLENYKSISACDLTLGPLTFLVGKNGSGKSNFLDALRLVADSLRNPLDHALRDRGGIGEVRRRSGGHPTHFGIRLDLRLPSGEDAHYSFKVAARRNGGFEVQQEQCQVKTGSRTDYFEMRSGNLARKSVPAAPPGQSDRLYLVVASSLREFRPVFDALSQMGFYNLNPQRIRELQSPDPGTLLARDGFNLASVLRHLQQNSPRIGERVQEYLTAIVPDISSVAHCGIGPKETLEFKLQVAGQKSPWRFLAANMSDGTLRALAVLVSLFQSANGGPRSPLVGIEEPEAALHPGAAQVLFDAIQEASGFTQIVVTSHSPDLLDNTDIDPASIYSVDMKEGTTEISQLSEDTKRLLQDRLFTAGELMRNNQLEALSPSRNGQLLLKLFDETLDG